MKRIILLMGVLVAVLVSVLFTTGNADDGQVLLGVSSTGVQLQVQGEKANEWRFQSSPDLLTWTNCFSLGTLYSSKTNPASVSAGNLEDASRFYRAVKTEGLFDPWVLRTVNLTFTAANWQSILVSNYTSGSNLVANLELDGTTYYGVGVRYRGNTSYTSSGTKKSLNIDINYTNADLRLDGYKALNLNNANLDDSVMREPLYFNTMRLYSICPRASIVKLNINGEYWGIYSFVQQEDGDLIKEWCPSNDGDRWRAPNMAGQTTTTNGTGGMPGGTTNLIGGGTNIFGGDTNAPGGGTNIFGGGTNAPGGGTNIFGGGTNAPGGGTNIFGGGTNAPDGGTNILGGGTNIPGGDPNAPGGGDTGTMVSSGVSALTYLGTNIATYQANYVLKTDNSTNAWERLLHATDVLNNTPTNTLRDQVEEVLAVDRWLWFLALENIFTDEDSYYYKGSDYTFYYEPESGRIHPVEHDGNESLVSNDYTLSPVQGASDTNLPVLKQLLSIAELRQRYLAHMRTVLEESFNPTVLLPVIAQYRQLTVDVIQADTKKNYTMAAYASDLLALTNFVQKRYAFLTSHAELTPLPPTIVAVSAPATTPTAQEVPYITAQVQANGGDGIGSVWLYYRAKSYGRFTATPMCDDGRHGDGAAGDGVFGGATTNYAAGTKVRFYLEARSANSTQTACFAPRPRRGRDLFLPRHGRHRHQFTAGHQRVDGFQQQNARRSSGRI